MDGIQPPIASSLFNKNSKRRAINYNSASKHNNKVRQQKSSGIDVELGKKKVVSKGHLNNNF